MSERDIVDGKAMPPASAGSVCDRITAYLASGGLFNPEQAIHDRVRDLLIDARDEIARLRLTDAEREAVWSAIEYGEDTAVSGLPPLWAAALRRLLARLGGER